jgi:membrane-bound inhibitor of C-type lysozyme
LVLAACQPAQPPAAGGNDARRLPRAAGASTEGTGSETTYQCGDLSVRATFNGEDAATVVIGERTFAMTSERAASGAKYGDGRATASGPRAAMTAC